MAASVARAVLIALALVIAVPAYLGPTLAALAECWMIGEAIFGFSSPGHPRPPRAAAAPPADAAQRALKIVDQRVVPAPAGGSLYVAVVRDSSATRTAFDVRPDGLFEDRSGRVVGVTNPPDETSVGPSIPPGRTAVVMDYYESDPETARATRFDISMRALKGLKRAKPPPASTGAARLNHRRCLVSGIVSTPRRRRRVDVALVGRDRRGRILWGATGVAGPLPGGAVRQVFARVSPFACTPRVRSVQAYPWFWPEELKSPRAGSR